MDKKTQRNMNNNEDIYELYNQLKYKYSRIMCENAALKLELKIYKTQLVKNITNDVNKEILEESRDREKKMFREYTIMQLKNQIHEKEEELKKYKNVSYTDRKIENSGEINRKDIYVNETLKCLSLSRSLDIVKLYGLKKAFDYNKTINSENIIDSILNLTPEEINKKNLKTDEIFAFTQHYPMIKKFIEEKTKTCCIDTGLLGFVGSEVMEICKMINEIYGEDYIKKIDIERIGDFCNKIIR